MFQVAATADSETLARVESDETGGGLVLWSRDRGKTDLQDIYGRWLGSDGNPARDAFIIEQAAGNQRYVAAAGDDGEYLIAWQDDRNGNWDIYAARYARLPARRNRRVLVRKSG